MRLPKMAGGVHRNAAGRDFTTDGVHPAFFIDCHCHPDKDINWRCDCFWRGANAGGSCSVYADGSWECNSWYQP
jgi:hypothetical protein